MIRRSRPPVVPVAVGAVAALFFVVPLASLIARTPWSRLGSLLGSDVVIDAIGISLVSSVLSAVLCVIFGVPLAWMLARVEFWGRSALRAVVTLPLVLPPVVAGTALLFALGRRGVVGSALADGMGIQLPFTLAGVVLAATFVAMPFLVITVGGALSAMDRSAEEAAASLGASPSMVFWRVTLPQLRPTIAVAAAIAWARALGEFGATITFAGNLQGRTQTLPLAVFVARESDQDMAATLALVMMVISLSVLIVLRDRWWGKW